jgi:hypothetical protein
MRKEGGEVIGKSEVADPKVKPEGSRPVIPNCHFGSKAKGVEAS